MSTRPRSSTWEWGDFAVAMRYVKAGWDSWVAKRLCAATRVSSGRWLALVSPPFGPDDDAERAGHSVVTYGCSLQPNITFGRQDASRATPRGWGGGIVDDALETMTREQVTA